MCSHVAVGSIKSVLREVVYESSLIQLKSLDFTVYRINTF